MKKTTLFLLFVITFYSLSGQQKETDKCGFPPYSKFENSRNMDNWGYGYDDLISDIETWRTHQFVSVDTIGKSVENRDIYMLTFQKPDIQPQYRIHIHARTHPNEVQSTHVTNEIIALLLDEENETANRILSHCIVGIVPMINPDGVELEKSRENANDIDLERNWATATPEPEVAALKTVLEIFMNSDLPVHVALNMHSAHHDKRYFVYHHSNGTSPEYAQDEIDFIESIQSYFPDGIEDWDYYISWTDGAPDHFPESWFWNNYQEAVMALTYEDMNNDQAGDYDITANAIMAGTADYLELDAFTNIGELSVMKTTLYPNPVKNGQKLTIQLPNGSNMLNTIEITGIDGKTVLICDDFVISGQSVTLIIDNLPPGLYILKAANDKNCYTNRLLIAQ